MSRAKAIAFALGGARKEGNEWRCRCPLHGGRALLLRDDGRGLLVHCFAGCPGLEIYRELRRRGLLDGGNSGQREGEVVRARLVQHQLRRDADRTASALRIWNEAKPAAGTVVEAYLRSRGILFELLASQAHAALRLHPQCRHPSGLWLPAMVALVEHVERGPVAVHRTFLDLENASKAHVTPTKACLGPVGGGAVRLGEAQDDEWLAIAEGIETAASVAAATRMPTWAALSAGGMITLILPPSVKRVVLCADNDANGVGQRAATDAARRFLLEGRRVRIAIAPIVGADMNDVLNGTVAPFMKEAAHGSV